MNFLRACRISNLRLCQCKIVDVSPIFNHGSFDLNTNNSPLIAVHLATPKRHFSLQSAIEVIARTQTGIFQTLSESSLVQCTQGLLLTVHNITGLPWWTTIICTTLFLRSLVTVPLAIYQQYIMAKVENLNSEMPDIVKELNKEMAVAIKLYNWDEKRAKFEFKRAVKQQWNKLVVRENCHPVKASLLLWFQIPMWISVSVSLRNLVYELPKQDFEAKLTFTELTIGGFGWIPNLIEADNSLILPIALGLLNLSIIEIQTLSKVNPPSKFQRYLTHFFRGLSIVMIPIAASVPSCLALYWTTSSAYGVVQNLILMSPSVKRICRIPVTPSQLEKPYSHIYSGIKHRLSILNNK